MGSYLTSTRLPGQRHSGPRFTRIQFSPRQTALAPVPDLAVGFARLASCPQDAPSPAEGIRRDPGGTPMSVSARPGPRSIFLFGVLGWVYWPTFVELYDTWSTHP